MKKIFLFFVSVLIVFNITTVFAQNTQVYKFQAHPLINEKCECLKISGANSYMENDTIYVDNECTVEITEQLAYLSIYLLTDNGSLNSISERADVFPIYMDEDLNKYSIKNGTYKFTMNFGGFEKDIRVIIGSGIYASENPYFFKTEIMSSANYTYYGQLNCYKNNVLLWTYNTGLAPLNDSASITDAYVNNDTVYFSSVNRLFALDLETGNLIWSAPDIARGMNIEFDKHGNVYVSGYYGQLYTVVNKYGQILDKQNYSGWVNNITINGDMLYAECYKYDEKKGEVKETLNFDISKYYDLSNKETTDIPVTYTFDETTLPDYAERKLKEFCKQNFRDDNYLYNGIYDAFLADLDGDRIPELLVATSHSSSHIIEVYKYSNGQTQKSDNAISHPSAMAGGKVSYQLQLFNNGAIKIHTRSCGVDFLTQENIDYYKETIEHWTFNQNHLISSYMLSSDLTTHYTINDIEAKIPTRTDYKDFETRLSNNIVFSAANHAGYSLRTYSIDEIWQKQKSLYDSYGLQTDLNKDFIVLQINNPNMNVAGKIKKIDTSGNATPVIADGRTLVPIRAIIESLGGSVSWDEIAQKITLNYNNTKIELKLNSTTAVVNGENKTLDVPPITLNDRTIIPIRFVAETFKLTVDWNEVLEQITILY